MDLLWLWGQLAMLDTGIISFLVRYGNDRPGLYLHYNFVAAVLNDLFGVQAGQWRGCSILQGALSSLLGGLQWRAGCILLEGLQFPP